MYIKQTGYIQIWRTNMFKKLSTRLLVKSCDGDFSYLAVLYFIALKSVPPE